MLYDKHMVFLICLSQAKIDMADIRLLYVPYASHTVYTTRSSAETAGSHVVLPKTLAVRIGYAAVN
jgi:hypothetical protein